MIRFAFAALMALVLFPLPALAQTTVNLLPIFEPVLSAVATTIGLAAVWLLNKAIDAFRARVGIELEDQHRVALQEAILYGVSYGENKALAVLRKHGSAVDFKTELMAAAAEYIASAVPEAIEYFEISEKRLVEMIESRVGVDIDGNVSVGGAPSTDPNIKLAS